MRTRTLESNLRQDDTVPLSYLMRLTEKTITVQGSGLYHKVLQEMVKHGADSKDMHITGGSLN